MKQYIHTQPSTLQSHRKMDGDGAKKKGGRGRKTTKQNQKKKLKTILTPFFLHRFTLFPTHSLTHSRFLRRRLRWCVCVCVCAVVIIFFNIHHGRRMVAKLSSSESETHKYIKLHCKMLFIVILAANERS